MMTINIVCVGNLKEKFSLDEQNEYLKRLSAFCKVNIIELKEQNKYENVEVIKQKEGEEILKNISSYTYLCDIEGKQFSSASFAENIKNVANETSKLTFVIGGSYGVSEEVKNAIKNKISFSKMTFPHNLFRIMLLEQIYRAFTILSGKKYNK